MRREVEQHDGDQERLLGLFAFLEKWLPNSNFRGCAFLNIASEFPSPGNEVRLLVANHKNALWDYIKQLVNKLGISAREDDLAALTNLIYLLFEGAISESQVHRSTRFIQVAQEAARRLVY